MEYDPKDVVREGLEAPVLRALSRREFIRCTVKASAVMFAGKMVLEPGVLKADEEKISQIYKVLKLTDKPSQNPAFQARGLSDGGAVAWVRKNDGSTVAYGLNESAKRAWELCDGVKTMEEVVEAYTRISDRPAEEIQEFVTILHEKGLVVYGGYLKAPASFPYDSQTRRYLHRFSS